MTNPIEAAGPQAMPGSDSNGEPLGLDRPASEQPKTSEPGTNLLELVAETIDIFSRRGIASDDMAPLFRLQDALRSCPMADCPDQTEARRIPHTNEALLGRACVVIDLMTYAGATSEKAAQTIARQLSAAGVRFPDDGGDARAWKRLINFRLGLLHGSKTDHVEAREAHRLFKAELGSVPADRRVQQALEQFM